MSFGRRKKSCLDFGLSVPNQGQPEDAQPSESDLQTSAMGMVHAVGDSPPLHPPPHLWATVVSYFVLLEPKVARYCVNGTNEPKPYMYMYVQSTVTHTA